MDQTANPCDDFYQYACGNWAPNNPIPKDQGMYGVLSGYVPELVKQKMKKLLDEKVELSENSQAVDNAKILYKGCLSATKSIVSEERSLKLLRETLDTMAGWPIITDDWQIGLQWWEVVAYLKQISGYDAILITSVNPSITNSSKNIIYLGGGISQELRFRIFDEKQIAIQMKTDEEPNVYEKFITDVACIINENRCAKNKKEVKLDASSFLLVLQSFAKITQEQYLTQNKIFKSVLPGDEILRVPEMFRTDNNEDLRQYLITVKVLQREIKKINWLKFLRISLNDDKGLITDDTQVLTHLPSLKKIFYEVEGIPTRHLNNYILWQFVARIGPYISSKISESAFHFERSLMTGAEIKRNINDTCVDFVSSCMGLAVANLYSTTITESDFAHAEELITNIKKGAIQRLQENNWLDNETKTASVKKIEKMGHNIAFPEIAKNRSLLNDYYKSLGKFKEDDFFLNAMTALALNHLTEMSKLVNPVDKKHDWPRTDVMITNAYYFVNVNNFYLPVGIMHFPIFQKDSVPAINFGGVGYIIGHEMFHGFDERGSLFDERGVYNNWWTADSKKLYESKKLCMANQYSTITEEMTGSNINGQLTLSENIADTAGLAAAFKGYKEYSKEDIRFSDLMDISGDKLFFISAAQVWCDNMRKIAMERQLTDSHAPSKYRAIVPFGNSDDFLQTFQCGKYSAMRRRKCELF